MIKSARNAKQSEDQHQGSECKELHHQQRGA